jgi:hypothetical protein
MSCLVFVSSGVRRWAVAPSTELNGVGFLPEDVDKIHLRNTGFIYKTGAGDTKTRYIICKGNVLSV